LIIKISVFKKFWTPDSLIKLLQAVTISAYPVYRILTTRIKGEVEKARKRAIEGGEEGVFPFRFCNSCVCCAQIIPLGPFAVSPLRTFDRTRKPRSRRNSFAIEPVRKTCNGIWRWNSFERVVNVRWNGWRREFNASASIKAAAASNSALKFVQHQPFVFHDCLS